MSKSKHIAVGELLMDLECEMRTLGLWEQETPSPEALASTQPFAVDTLSFPQWVQFIFIDRMLVLVETRDELPDRCGIAPMSEEYFRNSPISGGNVTAIFHSLDVLLSSES